MYNTTEAVKAALGQSVVRMRLLSESVPDGRIEGDQFARLSYSAGCCGGDIGIGSVSAASLSGSIHGVVNLLGVTFTAQVGVDVDGVTQWLNLGTFTVTECNRTDDSTTFMAYDAAYTALGAVYTPTVQSGATVYAVLEDLADQCGLDVEQTTLNYGLQIPVEGTLTGHTCREMVGYCAALCGKNAVITRDGFLRFVFVELTEQTITADDYYSGAMSNGGISKLWGLSCTVPGQEEEQTLTVGDAEKAVPVSCPYMTQAQLNAIWSTIGGYEYPVGNVSFYRGLLTEPGDLVSLTNLAGDTITLPAMQVNLEIDGGCRCTISSFGKSEAVRMSGTAGPTEKRLQSAQRTASRALLSANGKNKNFYQSSAPTTADGLTPGDLWFDTANGNRISEWTGSAWSTFTLQNAAISNLDVGAITSGRLSAARINVEDIFAQDITATGIIRGARFTTGGRFSVDQHGYLQSESGSFSSGSFSECHMQNGYVNICSCEDLRWFVEYWGNPPPEGESEDPDTPRRYDRRVYRLFADSNGYTIGVGVLPSWYSDQLTPQVVPDPNELWEEASNRMTLARFWADSNGTGWVDVNGLNVSGNLNVSGSMTVDGNKITGLANGTFAKSTNSITNVERNFWTKCGKIVSVDLTFTVGTAISDYTAELFNGLPESYGHNTRFRCPHGTDSSVVDLVLAVTTNGKIINQWSQGGVRTGQYQCSFVYVCK